MRIHIVLLLSVLTLALFTQQVNGSTLMKRWQDKRFQDERILSAGKLMAQIQNLSNMVKEMQEAENLANEIMNGINDMAKGSPSSSGTLEGNKFIANLMAGLPLEEDRAMTQGRLLRFSK